MKHLFSVSISPALQPSGRIYLRCKPKSKFNLVCTWQRIQVKPRPLLAAPHHARGAGGSWHLPAWPCPRSRGANLTPRGKGAGKQHAVPTCVPEGSLSLCPCHRGKVPMTPESRCSALCPDPVCGMCHQVGALPMPMSPHRATMALAQPSPWCVMCQGWPSSVGWPVSPHCHPPTRKPRVTPVRAAGTPLRGAGPHNGTPGIVSVSGTVPLSLVGSPGVVKGIRNSFRRNFWGQKRSVLLSLGISPVVLPLLSPQTQTFL